MVGDDAESRTSRRGTAVEAHGASGVAGPGRTVAAVDSAHGAERVPAAGEAPAPWRAWLAGGSARDVLARIVQEDPLELHRRVASRLRAHAYLLDGDRVLLRCFALVARHASRYRGAPAFDTWLDAMVAAAVESVLREDLEPERHPDVSACSPAFMSLARPLGLEPDALVRACVRFNHLPTADRLAFCALVLRSRTLEDVVRETGENATEVARRARRGLETLLGTDTTRATRPASDAPAGEVTA